MSDFINFDYTEASLKNISRNGSKHKHISGSKKVDYRSMDENSGNILEDMAGDYNIKKNHEKSVEIPSKGNVYQDKNKLEEDHLNFNVKEWERYKNDIQYEIEEEYPPNDMIQVNPEDNNSIDSDDDEQKMSAIEWRKFKEDNEYSLDEIDEIKQNEEGSIINSDENQDELDAIEWEKVKNDLYEEEEEVELNENHENQNQNWDVMTSDKEMIDGNRITGVNEVNGLGEIQHNHDTSLNASKRRTSGVISNKSQSLISPSKTGMLVYGKNFSKEKSSDLDNSESNKLSKPRSIIEGNSKLSNKFDKSIEYNSSKEIKMDNHNNSKDKNRSANSSRISERKSLSNNSASFSRREGSELADLIQDNNIILDDDMINEESLEKISAKIKDKITDKGNDRGSDQESDEFESWMKFKETIDYNIEQANRAINKPAYLPKKPAVKNNSINKETLSSNRKEDTLSQHKTILVPLKESNLYDHDLQGSLYNNSINIK
ncbi:hypothetical protein K502DRAFT_247518 [Neoconidiobolus thromboides FSU 785]|nr:hypothetical protein K502DRAFT_247518 [Neoconidiobolus thromboides FSU 785]